MIGLVLTFGNNQINTVQSGLSTAVSAPRAGDALLLEDFEPWAR